MESPLPPSAPSLVSSESSAIAPGSEELMPAQVRRVYGRGGRPPSGS